MPNSLPNGAPAVTNTTTMASAVMPRWTSSSGPGEQTGAMRDPRRLHAHQRRQAHHTEQHQRGDRQCQAVLQRMPSRPMNRRAAAAADARRRRAASAGTRCSSPQPRHSCRRGAGDFRFRAPREHRSHFARRPAASMVAKSVGKLADRGADRRDFACDAAVGRRHLETEAPRQRRATCLSADRRLGLQHERPRRRSRSRRFTLSSMVASGDTDTAPVSA